MNPYQPPTAPLGEAPAIVTVGRLIRFYQGMVVASLLLGWASYFGLLDFLATPEMLGLREFGGNGGLMPLGIVQNIWLGLQAVWLVVAIGLFFFAWWARPLFIGAYAVSAILGLTGGIQVWFPWEYFLVACATLLDGGIMVLSFLPPLSAYFARERSDDA